MQYGAFIEVLFWGKKTPSSQCLQLECFLGLKDSLDSPFCHGFTPGPGKQSMALTIF